MLVVVGPLEPGNAHRQLNWKFRVIHAENRNQKIPPDGSGKKTNTTLWEPCSTRDLTTAYHFLNVLFLFLFFSPIDSILIWNCFVRVPDRFGFSRPKHFPLDNDVPFNPGESTLNALNSSITDHSRSCRSLGQHGMRRWPLSVSIIGALKPNQKNE